MRPTLVLDRKYTGRKLNSRILLSVNSQHDVYITPWCKHAPLTPCKAPSSRPCIKQRCNEKDILKPQVRQLSGTLQHEDCMPLHPTDILPKEAATSGGRQIRSCNASVEGCAAYTFAASGFLSVVTLSMVFAKLTGLEFRASAFLSLESPRLSLYRCIHDVITSCYIVNCMGIITDIRKT